MEIKKILIANRGEIAIRIMRTCRELGIETVSVHSTEDEDSLHVKLADESVCIGPAKSALSYLNIPSILSAAEITQSDAIHPGFGFLSENASFAQMCERWKVRFIGPSAQIIEKMGNKIRAKEIASEAGVPVLAPIYVSDIPVEQIKEQAQKIGYPLLIKAAAGGGGRGMKKVENDSQLIAALKTLEEEAKAAFGDGTLFIEKYIARPRHIEVQVLADQYSQVIHLGERDCTVQRRFQKLIEESPSSVLKDSKREEICNAAVSIAKGVGYDSVGTVEFLYDLDTEQFYFMEMNTRIQVEHPVTEMRTGIDLIAQQILVASGRKLKIAQKDVQFFGHSLECRINAENPITMAPHPGVINDYHRPGGIGVRVDDFIYSGYRVSPFYDSLLAKVIVHAPDRTQAIMRMNRALNETIITGICSNIDLHKRIINSDLFTKTPYSTEIFQQIQKKLK